MASLAAAIFCRITCLPWKITRERWGRKVGVRTCVGRQQRRGEKRLDICEKQGSGRTWWSSLRISFWWSFLYSLKSFFSVLMAFLSSLISS